MKTLLIPQIRVQQINQNKNVAVTNVYLIKKFIKKKRKMLSNEPD